jgi:hypothetical protein
MLELEILIELFGLAFEGRKDSSLTTSAPTPLSLKKINEQLGISIPPDFIKFAEAYTVYDIWFASIGDDIDNHNHILSLNKIFREEGLPSHLVMLNHGYDGDCDCWDTRQISASGEHPILYYNLDSGQESMESSEYWFASFREYLEYLCRARSLKSADKNIRRKAEKLLELRNRIL